VSGPGEALREALATLRAHRARSLLTLFGVVWGSAALVLLTSWGHGVQTMVERGFFRSGRNLTNVWAGRVKAEFSPAVDRRYLWFTSGDVEALRRRTHLADLVGGESAAYRAVTFREQARSLDVHGIEPVLQELRGVRVERGRALGVADALQRRRVAVLGATARARLLGARGDVGGWIRIDGTPFQVVGLLARVGTQLSRDSSEIDEQVWIPLSTYQSWFPAWWTDEPVVGRVLFRARDRRDVPAAQREVRAILADRLRVAADDDEAIGMFSSVEMLNRIGVERLTGVLFVLALTTLGIGGIGVVTLMLDSVHERRQEIGLRLALGARPRDILAQIFLEALALTLLGGLLGVALGVGGCLALAAIDAPDLVPLPELRPRIVALAAFAMTLVGVAAALPPARRALGVDPGIVLRME
jgi:putative ABC transport system permease protein